MQWYQKCLKKQTIQCCHVYIANSKQFNLETIWNKDKNVDKNILKLGICRLHLWIRSMEWVFYTACNLPIPPKNSQEFIENKKWFQHLFTVQLKKRVSFVRKGSGTSNIGNVARNFFNNPAVTGRILNLDTSMIKLSAILFFSLSCKPFLKHE